MDNGLAYDRKVADSFESMNEEHRKVLEWVGKDKKVLEIACHTGYVSTWLKAQGCIVTGVELNTDALQKALPHLNRAIQGNIESVEVWEDIEKEKYDVILFMHILEHLVDPDQVLKRAKQSLNDNGIIIICLPNISNWINRWDIFKGNFNYTEVGVMDKTHLKFYNYYTAQEFIKRNGYKVLEYFGNAWKVKFALVPHLWIIWRINKLYNKVIHSIMSPNMTDIVIVYKIGKE